MSILPTVGFFSEWISVKVGLGTSRPGSPTSDVYDEAIATEESTIDAIVSEELIQENTFWRGRTTETVEVIEEDAEITFEEEIQ